MTGRVDILLRIFEESTKKVKNEVRGPEKHCFLLNPPVLLLLWNLNEFYYA